MKPTFQIDCRAQPRAAVEHLAMGGRIQAAEQLQQRGFAAAAGTADGDEIARFNGQIDAAQGLNASLIVALAQVAHLQNGCSIDRLSHGAAPPPVKDERHAKPVSTPPANRRG